MTSLTQIRVATAHSAIYAEFLVGARNEVRITVAVVITLRVHATPIRADVCIFTLIDVLAVISGGVSALARGTLAGEGTGRVDAPAAGTQARHGGALVDVDTLLGLQITKMAVGAVEVSAALTGVSPGQPNGGATQLLSADDGLQRACTQRPTSFGIAWSSSSIDLAALA